MRTFIAIDFTSEMIEKIERIINYFHSQTPEKALKWVAPQNLHLTIKFLGEVPDDKIEDVKEIISQNLTGIKSFAIGVEGLGMYPNTHQPRVIWLGITNAAPLITIHNSLEKGLKNEDIPPDKHGLSPHLTIARLRRRAGRETAQDIGQTLSQFKVDSLGTCLIDKVILYKSELTPKGPIYTPLLSRALDKV